VCTQRPEAQNPFKRRQWAELAALVVLFLVQLGLQLAGHDLVAFIVGLPALALLIHAYTWMWPLLRERQRQRRGGDR
jgi:hypothetical protein